MGIPFNPSPNSTATGEIAIKKGGGAQCAVVWLSCGELVTQKKAAPEGAACSRPGGRLSDALLRAAQAKAQDAQTDQRQGARLRHRVPFDLTFHSPSQYHLVSVGDYAGKPYRSERSG